MTRISGRGGGFSGKRKPDPERARRFRARHAVGQVVHGTVLEMAEGDLCWIAIDGQELLAQVSRRHPRGARLAFRIDRLTPQIQLRELHGQESAGAGMGVSARRFLAARQGFESAARGLPVLTSLAVPVDLERAAETYLAVLADYPAAMERLLDLTAVVAAINEVITPAGKTLYYLPWIMPAGREHETLVAETDGMWDVRTGFRLDDVGAVQLHLLAGSRGASVKLLAEDTTRAMVLGKRIAAMADTAGVAWLGASSMPAAERGGLVGQLIRR